MSSAPVAPPTERTPEFLIFAGCLILDAIFVYFGWNTFVTKMTDLSRISAVDAIGLSLLVMVAKR